MMSNEEYLDNLLKSIEEEIIEESNIEESNIEESNIEESNIEESNIEESNIEESNIEESNIEESNIEESNIEESNIEEEIIEESNIEESNIEEEIIEESNIEESNIEEVQAEELDKIFDLSDEVEKIENEILERAENFEESNTIDLDQALEMSEEEINSIINTNAFSEESNIVVDYEKQNEDIEEELSDLLAELEENSEESIINVANEIEKTENENDFQKNDLFQTEEDNKSIKNTNEKKLGLISKVLSFLTEEDELEEVEESKSNKNSQENQLDANKSNKKKEKKPKKEKPKKPKKEKPKKEKKPAKPKKPKKEKVEEVVTGKKLSARKVIPIFAACMVCLFAAIFISNVFSTYLSIENGVKAYYKDDYLECYKSLYGKNRNESQELMFSQAEFILKMNRIESNYNNFMLENKKAEALEILIQFFYSYNETKDYALEIGTTSDIDTLYNSFLGELQNVFNISVDKALEIAKIVDDVEYTREIYAIVQNEEFSNVGNSLENNNLDENYEIMDMLPGEDELGGTDFIG